MQRPAINSAMLSRKARQFLSQYLKREKQISLERTIGRPRSDMATAISRGKLVKKQSALVTNEAMKLAGILPTKGSRTSAPQRSAIKNIREQSNMLISASLHLSFVKAEYAGEKIGAKIYNHYVRSYEQTKNKATQMLLQELILEAMRRNRKITSAEAGKWAKNYLKLLVETFTILSKETRAEMERRSIRMQMN